MHFASLRLRALLAVLVGLALFASACGADDAISDVADTVGDVASDGAAAVGDAAGDVAEAAEDLVTDDDGEMADDDEMTEEGSDAIVTETADDSDLTPVEGGTLRYGLEADVDGLNPVTSALSSPGLTMSNAVFDTLVRFDENNEWVPYLAESFEPSEDLTSWTMTLREGVTFHDGTPLNAEAIRVNFETALGDPLVGLAVKPFYIPLEDGAFEIIDDLTVRYNLSDADAHFPTSLAGQLGMIASPTWLAAALEDPTLNQAPVGTGPFTYDGRSQDSITRFVRNENWWNGRPYLDAVEFVPVTDPDVRNQLLLEGELDGLATTNPASIAELAESAAIQNLLDDSGDESFAQLNTSTAPFDDIRARQALTHASPVNNYNTLINLSVTRPANQFVTPDSPYFNPDIEQLSDMPELAGPLVESYCADFADNCTDGKINMELQWSGPSVVQTRIAELLNEGWEPFFNVEFQELPQDQHIQETAFGLYNAVTWRTFGNPEFTRDSVWVLCRTIGGISLNWVKYCDEERDDLMMAAVASDDEAERTDLIQQWSAMTNEAYTYVFFNHTLWDNALTEDVRNACARTTEDGTPFRCSVNGRTWFDTMFKTN